MRRVYLPPWLLGGLLAAALTACGARREAVGRSYEAASADTVRMVVRTADTLVVTDSVHVDGPAVYRERTVYRTRTVRDTLWRVRTDTVRVAETRTVATGAAQRSAGSGLPWMLCGVLALILAWKGRQ